MASPFLHPPSNITNPGLSDSFSSLENSSLFAYGQFADGKHPTDWVKTFQHSFYIHLQSKRKRGNVFYFFFKNFSRFSRNVNKYEDQKKSLWLEEKYQGQKIILRSEK